MVCSHSRLIFIRTSVQACLDIDEVPEEEKWRCPHCEAVAKVHPRFPHRKKAAKARVPNGNGLMGKPSLEGGSEQREREISFTFENALKAGVGWAGVHSLLQGGADNDEEEEDEDEGDGKEDGGEIRVCVNPRIVLLRSLMLAQR